MTEWGDDVRPISEDEAMVIVNHQATGDVCTLMMCLQDKGTVRACIKLRVFIHSVVIQHVGRLLRLLDFRLSEFTVYSCI